MSRKSAWEREAFETWKNLLLVDPRAAEDFERSIKFLDGHYLLSLTAVSEHRCEGKSLIVRRAAKDVRAVLQRWQEEALAVALEIEAAKAAAARCKGTLAPAKGAPATTKDVPRPGETPSTAIVLRTTPVTPRRKAPAASPPAAEQLTFAHRRGEVPRALPARGGSDRT